MVVRHTQDTDRHRRFERERARLTYYVRSGSAVLSLPCRRRRIFIMPRRVGGRGVDHQRLHQQQQQQQQQHQHNYYYNYNAQQQQQDDESTTTTGGELWEGFSDDSADEDQMWAERDEWHQWRNRIDTQVSGALGTATAPSAMGRFARMQTKASKADRTSALQFGKFSGPPPRRGASPGRATGQQQLAVGAARTIASGTRGPGTSAGAANSASVGHARFEAVVEPTKPQPRKQRRKNKKKGRGDEDPLAAAKRAQMRKLDAARWERRGARTKFLSKFKKLPNFQQDVLDPKRKFDKDPVISAAAAAEAAGRLHDTPLMSHLVANKIDPARNDPAVRHDKADDARAAREDRAARRKRGKGAALNFGASVNILARQAHRAQARRVQQAKLKETTQQTKFRRRKQQLSRRKWDEYNNACTALARHNVEARFEETRQRPTIVLPSPERRAQLERATEAKANFLRKGDRVGPHGPGPRALTAPALPARTGKAPLRRLEASEAVELDPRDAEAAAEAAANMKRFMPLPKSVTAYRSYGALGESVVPPFGSGSLPRDSVRQVKLYDPMTGPKM